MNQLDRLEALAQRLIEGAFNRFFHVAPLAERLEDKIETKEVLALAHNDMAARWLLRLEDRQIRMGEPVVNIGRALDNDVVISDPTVSRYHAQLRWREGRYHLYPPERTPLDAQVEAGKTKETKRLPARTTVNQKKLDRCPLNPGDLLTLGETKIEIILTEAGP
jgi:hypothetical protein